MRHQASAAWLELGYTGPDTAALNAEVQVVRAEERRERQALRAKREAVPVRRREGKSWFALMHQAADQLIRCSESGRIEEVES